MAAGCPESRSGSLCECCSVCCLGHKGQVSWGVMCCFACCGHIALSMWCAESMLVIRMCWFDACAMI